MKENTLLVSTCQTTNLPLLRTFIRTKPLFDPSCILIIKLSAWTGISIPYKPTSMCWCSWKNRSQSFNYSLIKFHLINITRNCPIHISIFVKLWKLNFFLSDWLLKQVYQQFNTDYLDDLETFKYFKTTTN